MNRSFDIPRQSANGADPDRGTARMHAPGHEPEREDDEWRFRRHMHSRSYPEGGGGYPPPRQGVYEHARGYEPYGRDFDRERMDLQRYERGTGALPSTYGNVPYDPMIRPGQPWRGRDEEHDFWGQARHAPFHSHAHPSVWERVKGVFTGHGPKNYARSDERIREDVCEHLHDHPYIDASEIEVHVAAGEVTLTGTVDARIVKRAAEDCAEHVRGVDDVHNHLRVATKPAASATMR